MTSNLEATMAEDTNRTLARRTFLGVAVAAVATAGAYAWGLLPGGVRAAVARTFPTRTVERGEFRFDPDRGEVLWTDGRREPFHFVIDGLVEKPQSIGYAQLRALPLVHRTADFHCVEGWSVNDVAWGGVAFPTLLDLAQPHPTAHFAVFHSLGRTEAVGGLTHYVESFPLADLRNPALGAMLALDMAGQPLTLDRGAPTRVVSPFDLAYKSIKFVTRMELTDHPVEGWWTRANPIYPVHAPVDPSRLRTPDPRRS